MQSDRPILLWLRRDLRLSDNPALAAAAEMGRPVIPICVRPLTSEIGAAAWWLGESVAAMRARLQAIGSSLVLRTDEPSRALHSLARESGATVLLFNRSLEPAQIAVEAAVIGAMRERGVEVIERDANRLHEPWRLRTSAGDAFKVFTPFWRRLSEAYHAPPALPAPHTLLAPHLWPPSEPIEAWQVTAPWTRGLAASWQPGEEGAQQRLATFLTEAGTYSARRDRPDWDGTSRLSPHLAWGEISVHEAWRRVHEELGDAALPYLRQLGWRDFNSHLLYHFPSLPHESWTRRFARFPFRNDDIGLRAWQRGRTGYPLVDAGMRELWATGWMHNRVRMVAASFLIKDLLIDWRQGEAWFWDTLVDADLAQNAGNWQWVAGSGADAAPYFRIFNPVLQSRKFDPDGDYIRRWIPELARLDGKAIHAPWETAPLDLAEAGIVLGRDYPQPIVDHESARKRALAAYDTIR